MPTYGAKAKEWDVKVPARPHRMTLSFDCVLSVCDFLFPLLLSLQEVGKFIASYTKCGQYRETFEDNFINGKRLLRLNSTHLPQACSIFCPRALVN